MGPSAAGFGVTSEVGRSSCELEFQRPAAAEVVDSAHTFHVSQSNLGVRQSERGSWLVFYVVVYPWRSFGA